MVVHPHRGAVLFGHVCVVPPPSLPEGDRPHEGISKATLRYPNESSGSAKAEPLPFNLSYGALRLEGGILERYTFTNCTRHTFYNKEYIINMQNKQEIS